MKSCIREIKSKGVIGNFTSENNLHLTLAFIGETDRVNDLKSIIASLDFAPFKLTLHSNGYFRDLLWIGTEKNPPLTRLAKDLKSSLTDAGFDIDTKPFRPHITIARQISCTDINVAVPKATMTVEKISLMESKRIGGRLIYRELN